MKFELHESFFNCHEQTMSFVTSKIKILFPGTSRAFYQRLHQGRFHIPTPAWSLNAIHLHVPKLSFTDDAAPPHNILATKICVYTFWWYRRIQKAHKYILVSAARRRGGGERKRARASTHRELKVSLARNK